jgi:hypothetical protein
MKIAVEQDVFASVYTYAATANKGLTAGAISGVFNLGTTASPCFVGKTEAGAKTGATSADAKGVVDHIVDVNTVLDEQNVPETGRWAVIPAVMVNRIKKSELKDASISGDGTSIMRNGRIGVIDRTTIYSSNNIAPSSGKYNIFAGVKDAISFASQITKMESLRSQATFGNLVRGLNVFGWKVTKPEALVHSVVQMA